MRTPQFRYNLWIHFNRITYLPVLDAPPFAEELYDHRDDTLANFTHSETLNLILRPGYEGVAASMKMKLTDIIKKELVFRGNPNSKIRM